MELLKKYIDEIGKDLVVDDFNIKEVQMKLPSRKHFWVARLMNAKIEHQKLVKSKKDIKKDLIQRVIRDSPIKITTQSAEQVAENHESIQELTNKIKDYEHVIEYLEKVEKIMSQMHWEIKNIIEINKLEQL